MITKTVETSTDNPESALNNLEALVGMVFDHVGKHIYKDTGDLQAMHVYQLMLMATEQVDTLKRDAHERDMQFAREDAARRALDTVRKQARQELQPANPECGVMGKALQAA